jgi:RNA polymerase sigma-70 factor (ECF subfamily)
LELYNRYGPALLRKCERMLGSRPDAEDVVQTLFIDLLRTGRTGVDLPYLYRAATTRCLNAIRNNRRRSGLLARNASERVDDPEARVVSAQLLAVLVHRLDPLSAEILAYHYQDLLTQEEIADLTQVSRKTIGKKLQGIRDVLATLEGGAP